MQTIRQNPVRTLLAGDVGGTKTTLALFSTRENPRRASQTRTFKNEDFPGFRALLESYLAENKVDLNAISLGAAGPVIHGRVELTNLPWTVDAKELASEFNLQNVWILNDLQATAHAVPRMEREELKTVNPGQAIKDGPIAVIAPGTGLGEAYLTWKAGEAEAHASEGGHSDFAPRNAIQDELLSHLREQFEHVSYEQVCSGVGLPNIYSFLKALGSEEEADWLRERLAGAEDPTPVIVEAAMSKGEFSALCRKTVEIFVEVLAAEAGNLALKIGASGGVYIGGGIPPRILPLLEDGRFLKVFLDKGRYRNYLERIPVRVMLNTDAALLGAAAYGLRQLSRAE